MDASSFPEEDRPGSNQEIVLTYKLWQSRYGSNPNVVQHRNRSMASHISSSGSWVPRWTKPDYAQRGPHLLSPLKRQPYAENITSSRSLVSNPASLSRRHKLR